MSKKQRALEERYRKSSQGFKISPTGKNPKFDLDNPFDHSKRKEADRIRDEFFEENRECTLKDIVDYFDGSGKNDFPIISGHGTWVTFLYKQETKWERERSDIISVTRQKAHDECIGIDIRTRVRTWNETHKKHAIAEFKRRNSKLVKALK